MWLSLDDPFELLGRALGPPWETLDASSSHQLNAVSWMDSGSDGAYRHTYTWCERPDGGGHVCVHHFSPCEPTQVDELLTELRRLARADCAAERRTHQDADLSASNVNGHHSDRNVFNRADVLATGLPDLLQRVAQRAAHLEAMELGRAPLAVHMSEAWYNVLSVPSGWNTLHTHPGCDFACAFFVERGCDASASAPTSTLGALEGKLVLLPGAPAELAAHHRRHVRPPLATAPAPAQEAVGCTTATSAAHTPDIDASSAKAHLQFLLIDPAPGSIVVWPHFLPHFVAPGDAVRGSFASERTDVDTEAIHVLRDRVRDGEAVDETFSPMGADAQGPLRVSIAANFEMVDEAQAGFDCRQEEDATPCRHAV